MWQPIRLLILALLVACSSSPSTSTAGSRLAMADIDGGASVDATQASPKLVAFLGQSNAVGAGRVAAMTAEEIAYADPYPAVPYAATIGNNSDPPDCRTNPWGDLRPIGARSDGAPSFGIELTMGRALDTAEPGAWVLAKFALSGTVLGTQWAANSNYPAKDLAPTNLNQAAVEYIDAAIASRHAQLFAIVWIQGEGDAGTLALANAYGANWLALAQSWQARWPGVKIIYNRLHKDVGGAYGSKVRNGQDADDAYPGMVEVNVDAFQIDPNNRPHFTTSAYLQMGPVFADAALHGS
jgi:hypothetical protein